MRRRLLTLILLGIGATLPCGAVQPTPTPTPGPSHVLTRPTPVPAKGSGSLADVVRERKAKATPTPKKRSLGVITNESLKKSEGTGKGSVQTARPIAELPAEGTLPSASAGADEMQWRGRAAAARERVASAESEVKRLEGENKRLENDFYVWSDGNYRDGVIKPAWDQAREELKQARVELDTAQTALTDMDEEARKAGVPAGWLRQ